MSQSTTAPHLIHLDAKFLRNHLADLRVQPLSHFRPTVAHEHRTIEVHVNQRTALIQKFGDEAVKPTSAAQPTKGKEREATNLEEVKPRTAAWFKDYSPTVLCLLYIAHVADGLKPYFSLCFSLIITTALNTRHSNMGDEMRDYQNEHVRGHHIGRDEERKSCRVRECLPMNPTASNNK